MRRDLIGRLVATVGAAIALVGTFVPWLRSGTRQRSSYDVAALIDRLGMSRSSAAGWALRIWPVAPLLLVAAVTVLWFWRAWPGVVLAGVAAVSVGAVAAAVAGARSTALVEIESGPTVTLAGAIVLAAGALTSATGRGLRARRAAPAGGRS